jgi:hypothetical protein
VDRDALLGGNVERTVAALVASQDAEPKRLEKLYRELRLELRYEPHERAVDILLAPRVVNRCV